ncbi:hypothetical protein F0562_034277 [Nyssa sinensis]|uniref:Uncharacterized protein n=1 Tax=Nyssa sinensis TaxID=561372 RepID=A0A5J5AF64_9ASTE|nr:hypothetical protein F0562_034277 [Nyssa sinensis]
MNSPTPRPISSRPSSPLLNTQASLALKHFFPLAGNLIIPPHPSRPEIRYMNGDSVSLTFAESNFDFNYLTGNQARNGHEFYHLVPQMPEVSCVSNTRVAPLLALQVTIFPNFGICLGYTFHHVTADGNTLIRFLKSWASITKFGSDEKFLAGGSLPFYDRSNLVSSKAPKGVEKSLWNQAREIKLNEGEVHYPLTNNVRATFVMGQTQLQRLKKLVLTRRPIVLHVSTFTVTCAYVWVCLVKSRGASGEKAAGGDEQEDFVCVADCRGCFEPPIPETYFGNCLITCFAAAKNSQLVGEEGLITAAELIGEAIRKRPRREDGVLEDFGWGRPKKTEIISIDVSGAMSLNECRDSEGDLEVGLSLPKITMDAFATVFADGLKML